MLLGTPGFDPGGGNPCGIYGGQNVTGTGVLIEYFLRDFRSRKVFSSSISSVIFALEILDTLSFMYQKCCTVLLFDVIK